MREVPAKLDGVHTVKGQGIVAGLQVIPLRRIPDERGTIFHMLRKDDPHFQHFGEIYFTTIYANVIKGWHKHEEMSLFYACPLGRIKLVVYDDRAESKTVGTINEIYLGEDFYALVIIPPNVWNGFKGMSSPLALVANCCTHAHDPSRSVRLDPTGPDIPYSWDVRNC